MAAGCTDRKSMTRKELEQYSDALARIGILRNSIERIEQKIWQMNKEGYYAADVVTKGRKGKKPLGTVVVKGFPHGEYRKLSGILKKRRNMLKKEEENLAEMVAEIEESIEKIDDIEIRNILSLYYVENLTWVQVAHRMNAEYRKKRYTSDSCRCKHDRFIKKLE